MKRKLSLLICIITITAASWAQTLNSLYFMNEWSNRHRSNASFAPETGYVSIPFLGSSQFSIASNLGLSTFVYPYNSELVTFMHPSVDANQFINSLSENNYFSQESNNNFISFGFYGDNSEFWSFGMSLKEQLNVNVPIDFFKMAKIGMSNSNNHYNLNNFHLRNTYYGELSVGYSRDIDEKLRLGGKVKLLAGLVSTTIDYSQFDVDLSQQVWKAQAKGEMMLNSNSLRFGQDADGNLDFTNYKFDLAKFKPSGYGISFDFGATYQPIDGLTLGASFSDLGFITWRRRSWQRGVADGSFTFEGFKNIDVENIDLDKQLNDLEKDAKKLIQFKEEESADEYKLQELPATWNVSADYSFFQDPDRDVSVGMLWNSRYIENKFFTELMGALTVKPFHWVTSSLTYVVASNRNRSLGFALNFSPKWINVFIASDGINTRFNRQFMPIDPFYTSFQAGITIPLARNTKARDTVKTYRLRR